MGASWRDKQPSPGAADPSCCWWPQHQPPHHREPCCYPSTSGTWRMVTLRAGDPLHPEGCQSQTCLGRNWWSIAANGWTWVQDGWMWVQNGWAIPHATSREKALSGLVTTPLSAYVLCPNKHFMVLITESQNHRIVGVGRDLCGSSSLTPC